MHTAADLLQHAVHLLAQQQRVIDEVRLQYTQLREAHKILQLLVDRALNDGVPKVATLCKRCGQEFTVTKRYKLVCPPCRASTNKQIAISKWVKRRANDKNKSALRAVSS